jgi:hypothetical protein
MMMRNTPILRAAFIMTIAGSVGWFATVVAKSTNSTLLLVFEAIWAASSVALMIGCGELASRLHGREAIGARIAQAGFAAFVAFDLVERAVIMFSHDSSLSAFFTIYEWMIFAGTALTIIGLALAAWDRNAITIVAIVVAALTSLPPPLRDLIHRHFKLGELVFTSEQLVQAAALLVLAARCRPNVPVPSPAAAATGLRWMSGSLWARLVIALVVLVAALPMASAGSDSQNMVRVMAMGELLLEIALLVWFAAGALKLARAQADQPRTALIVAGLMALWCAGVVMQKVPALYSSLWKNHGYGFEQNALASLTVVEPIVAMFAIASAALALRSFAALHDYLDLTTSRVPTFVLLMFASISLEQWGLPAATSEGSALGIMALGGLLALIATGLAAALFGRVANAFEAAPTIPTATVVGGS